MFGNLGQSWNNTVPNDLYIKNVPKKIVGRFDSVGNSGVALTTLHSYTIPAGTLKDNDFVTGVGSGSYANNDNNKKVIFVIFGVAVIEDFLAGVQDVDGGGSLAGWNCNWGVGRIDATHIAIFTNLAGQFYFLDGAGGVIINGSFHHLTRNQPSLVVPNLDSNNLIIEFEGQATANNDVTQTYSNVFLTRS